MSRAWPAHIFRPAPTTTLLAHDCNAELDTFKDSWSSSKKDWCCQRQGKGCDIPTTTVHWDCSADAVHAQTDWSMAKKAWCCTHGGVGCPSGA